MNRVVNLIDSGRNTPTTSSNSPYQVVYYLIFE